ncbi:hypothetical protein [Caenimonas sp. SL110]|uniref:hypothetical protein n=1 Tax=Caenimonas sp. SL110 TaxID=1450524 RepID=UPI00065422F8|nr:hypothetical protein [Caenimonas sp. SL110]
MDVKHDGRNTWRVCTLATLLLIGCAAAQAAGGHHAVDDAAILDAGSCEIESWISKASGGSRLLHAGAGCRVGPVELGVGAEYARQGGVSETSYQVQAKWATAVSDNLNVGLSLTAGSAAHTRPSYQGTTASLLLTWAARDDINVHLNMGRDFVHRGPRLNRSGVSAEWAFKDGWWLVGERYAQDLSQFARLGVRGNLAPGWTLDFSRAQRLRGPGESDWTLGLTRAF